MTNRISLCIYWTTLALPSITAGDDLRDLKDLISRNSQAQELRHRYLDFKIHLVAYDRNGKINHIYDFEVAINGKSCRQVTFPVSLENNRASKAVVAFGLTEHYHYRLIQKGTEWVIVELSKLQQGTNRFIYASEHIFAAQLFGHSYSKILTHQTTKNLSNREIKWKGAKHRELYFETKMNSIQNDQSRLFGIIVGPDRPDLVLGIREYDPERPSQWLFEVVIEYRDLNARFPVVKSVEEFVADKTANYEPWKLRHYDVTNLNILNETKSEINLGVSFFGLKEPKSFPVNPISSPSPHSDFYALSNIPKSNTPDSGQNYTWILWILTFLVALFVAVLLYRRRKL